MAGWHEYPPYHPRRFDDTDPRRLGRRRSGSQLMDSYGIQSQVLYPNVAVFDAKTHRQHERAGAPAELLQAYNDFLTDWQQRGPDRFIAVAALPFWDLDATLAEIDRCAAMGHQGIVFTQDPGYFGLPELTDRHWDPMWASAQEKGLPVNFHIASGDLDLFSIGHPDNGLHANYASMGVSFFMGNARTIAQLICGGICHRFPDLNFVSVESGIGWIPFALEALDWQWKNCGVADRAPRVRPAAERVLPPPDLRVLLVRARHRAHARSSSSAPTTCSTRPTSRTRRACRPARRAPPSARTTTSRGTSATVDETTLRKILHDNAARIYHLD